MVLKEEDISVFVANWDNKADNIRLVQKTLNIGFDSLRLPRRQSVRAQHRAPVPARRRRAGTCPRTRPRISRPWPAQPVRDRVVLGSRPAARRPIPGRGPARADQDPLHQHQRLSDLARHGDQARAIQRLQPAAHRPAHSAQQPVQSDDAPLRRGGLRSDDEGPFRRAADAQARRQIRRLRPDFGRHSQARRRAISKSTNI